MANSSNSSPNDGVSEESSLRGALVLVFSGGLFPRKGLSCASKLKSLMSVAKPLIPLCGVVLDMLSSEFGEGDMGTLPEDWDFFDIPGPNRRLPESPELSGLIDA